MTDMSVVQNLIYTINVSHHRIHQILLFSTVYININGKNKFEVLCLNMSGSITAFT